ncbi:MAG: D-alanyl-D-alanine endopeptidase [Gallionellaceae bacterium]|jgi:D-alanyl-D-alanine endopeptidase (penicillin-binding protein 7)|nr:D-alanyl-D-alanine endopeptidase [Gallionellaceae bacterium]
MIKKLFIFILLAQALMLQATSASAAPQKNTSTPQLRSNIALIYDEKTQHPLYQKNADTVAPIASISKLMTAMVVLDANLPMNESIRITHEDIDTLKGTHSRIKPGMELTRGELLKLALMASENRAAAALARTYPGGTQAAVAQMNAKARELGMDDTQFFDPTGLNSNNVSTAADLVKMVQAAHTYSRIRKATTTTSDQIAPAGFGAIKFNNTNPLVKNASWNIELSKTGYINEAGRCLVMKATINRRPVVIVLLDSWGKNTRVGDANRVRKWMESAFPARPVVQRG